jgi:hypothetical protein
MKIMERITQKREQEQLWKLACEVRAKNGMKPTRMKDALKRLSKAGMTLQPWT